MPVTLVYYSQEHCRHNCYLTVFLFRSIIQVSPSSHFTGSNTHHSLA